MILLFDRPSRTQMTTRFSCWRKSHYKLRWTRSSLNMNEIMPLTERTDPVLLRLRLLWEAEECLEKGRDILQLQSVRGSGPGPSCYDYNLYYYSSSREAEPFKDRTCCVCQGKKEWSKLCKCS